MRKREVLPSSYNMAIAEINQRFYPIRTHTTEEGLDFSSIAQFDWSYEDTWFIPNALGPRHTTGPVSFPTYAEAINFCHRREEHWGIILDWKVKATRSEVYPERNAWYAQEIQRLTGNAPFIYGTLFDVHVCITFYDGTIYSVDALTIDDAMSQLYEDVYELVSTAHTEEHPTVLIEKEYA